MTKWTQVKKSEAFVRKINPYNIHLTIKENCKQYKILTGMKKEWTEFDVSQHRTLK